MSDLLINRVTESALQEIDPATYYPKEAVAVFDLKPFLFMELILKEKDFREAMKNHDWSQYQDKLVAVTCTADAIIPVWAYMLVAVNLEPVAKAVVVGNEAELHKTIFLRNLEQINPHDFIDKRVVVKGCGELSIGEFAYLEIARRLRPVVKSIMYGEPCSTVPIYKKK